MVRIHEMSLISLVALVGNGEMHVNMWFLSKRILWWWLEYMLLKLVWGSLMNINWKVLQLLCEDFLVFQGFICHCVPALHLLVWCRIFIWAASWGSFCFVRQLATGEALELLRLALENVAAILCHKHWDIRNLVESVIAKCLAGLLYHPFCILKRIIQSACKHSSTLIDLTKFIPQKLEVARLIQPIDRNPTATATVLVWIGATQLPNNLYEVLRQRGHLKLPQPINHAYWSASANGSPIGALPSSMQKLRRLVLFSNGGQSRYCMVHVFIWHVVSPVCDFDKMEKICNQNNHFVPQFRNTVAMAKQTRRGKQLWKL